MNNQYANFHTVIERKETIEKANDGSNRHPYRLIQYYAGIHVEVESAPKI